MRMFGHGWSHMHFKSLPHRAGELSWKKLIFPVFIFLIFPAAVAYASLLFLSPRGDFLEVNMQKKSINSQNIILPSPIASPEFSSKDTSAYVSTVSESAVWAFSGPSGGLADVGDEDYNHGQISTYVVRGGDTFSSIANMFDVSVNTILWANNLPRGATLAVGQTLVILPVSGVQYTVKKNDTISGIATTFKGDVDEIRSYNDIASSEKLQVGTVIIIPDGVSSMPTSALAARLRAVSGPSYDGFYAPPLSAGFRKTQGLHGYNGIDLALYRGAPVFSAAAGTIVVARRSGYNGGYGKYVVIAHANGTQTLYGHLDSVTVLSGEVVSSGQQIGTIGNTGRSTGAHLHFEVRGARNPF